MGPSRRICVPAESLSTSGQTQTQATPSRLGRVRPVGRQPTDLIRGHPPTPGSCIASFGGCPALSHGCPVERLRLSWATQRQLQVPLTGLVSVIHAFPVVRIAPLEDVGGRNK